METLIKFADWIALKAEEIDEKYPWAIDYLFGLLFYTIMLPCATILFLILFIFDFFGKVCKNISKPINKDS